MTETMVERVGLALANQIHGNGDFGMSGADAYERRALEFQNMARAAIEAMRPATNAMLLAGWPYYSAMSNEPNGVLDGAQKRHDAYISAALSEPTTRERRVQALSDLAALDGETMD